MRILVTGSQGHIGRALVPMLHGALHDVVTFDRAAAREEPGTVHRIGDLRDIYAVREAVQGVDAVAHLGAISHDGGSAPEDVLAVNVQGTWNVLLACAEAGVGRVVFFSSVNALGHFGGHRPPPYLPVDDRFPPHPMTPYQLSKHLGEEACRSFSERHGIVTVCLRPAFVSTPQQYERWREQGDERRSWWGKKDFWAYVDIRDVCEAVMLGLSVTDVTHDAFLLTSDDTTMETSTADLVAEHYPDVPWPEVSRSSYLAEDRNRSLVDCSHAREVLGWRPTRTWRD